MLDVALAGVAVVAIDTAPLIYFIERHPAHVDVMRAIFTRVDAGKLQACSSTVALMEVLTQPLQLGNTALAAAYRGLLLNSRNFELVPVDAAVADRAADLRARFRLHTPDAMQIAAALARNCGAFLTNDDKLKRVTDVRVLLVSQLTV